MSGGRPDQPDQICERLRRAVFDVVHAVLGPALPDAMQKIEGVLREVKRDWEQERGRCQDEADPPASGP